MNKVKKLLACLLAMVFLSAGASAENWINALFSGANVPEIQYVSVPDVAFSEGNSRVIAATADENRILICSNLSLYIWDKAHARRVPIVFTDEADIEAFDLRADTAAIMAYRSMSGNTDIEELKQKVADIKEAYLRKNALERFTSLDDISNCYPGLFSLFARAEAIGPRFALVDLYQFGIEILLDMQTGNSRLVDDRILSLHGDRLITSRGITRLDTGETYMPDFMSAYAAGVSGLIDLELINDDNVLVLYPDYNIAEDSTLALHVLDVSGEETKLIDIGAYSAMRIYSFRLICTYDGRYAAVCPSYGPDQSVIIDRESFETLRTELNDILFAAPAQSAFICYDMKTGELALFDPATLTTTPIRLKGMGLGAKIGYAQISTLADNGLGLYFVQGEKNRGYFKLVND